MSGPVWARVVVGAFAAQNLVTGGWALAAPPSWYESFPGFHREWIQRQDDAYNEHLISDTGSGFLAVALALVVATLWWKREAVQVALVALIAHAVPHFAHHVTHPSEHPLETIDIVVGVWGIGLQAVVAAAVLATVSRGSTKRTARVADRRSTAQPTL